MREAYVNFHSFINNCLKWPRWLRPWTVSLFEDFNHIKNTGVLICELFEMEVDFFVGFLHLLCVAFVFPLKGFYFAIRARSELWGFRVIHLSSSCIRIPVNSSNL